MSGTTNTNDDQMFTGEKSEFGMRVFSDPLIQESYKNFEEEYKKKYVLKCAYDNQEFLRKMRADIKREYLTRKKQMKRLQKDAAIDFRNAEMSLHEHYASSCSQENPFSIRAIDICGPLVSQVTLPNGDVFDVKTFHPETEFDKVIDLHESLIQKQNESKDQWMKQEQQRQSQDEWEAVYAQASWNRCVTQQEEDPITPHCDQSPSTDIDIDIDLSHKRKILSCWDPRFTMHDSGAFGECCKTQIDTDTDALNIDNKWCLPMTAAEKMILEEGEAAQNQRNEFPDCYWTYIGTHDAIDHAGWVLNSVKQRRANAGMTDEEHDCDDDCPAILPNEPASAGGILLTNSKSKARKSANNKKKNAAASAAKARVAKQQKQQQCKKFAPLHVTINDNRSSHNQSEALCAMLSASKIEINLPKKNLQNISREAMKRHNQKWNRINAQNKQSAARGTGIANLPSRHHDDEYSDYE